MDLIDVALVIVAIGFILELVTYIIRTKRSRGLGRRVR